MTRFIKFIASEKADWLRQNFPHAFLLLSVIAQHARRTPCILDGLEIGDCLVGEIETSRDAGLTTKEYRNALIKLEELGFIETVWNPKNKKQQKRAIKRAIKSKIVNLLNCDIWDINPEDKGDQKGDQRAIKGRSVSSAYMYKESKECKEHCKKGNVAMGNVAADFAIASLPQSKKKSYRLNEEQEETLDWLLNLGLDTNAGALRYWARTWSREKIEKAYCYMLSEQKVTSIKNPAGFIRNILEGKIIAVDENSIKNKSRAEKLAREHPELKLTINEKYVKSDLSAEWEWEAFYYWPEQQFQISLSSLFEKVESYV